MAQTTSDGHLKFIKIITDEDAAGLIKAHESYGDSWKRRGGVGAYMVMIRKFDRMERAAEKNGWDIFEAVRADPRVEGILDDIRDARRYLTLIESALREMGLAEGGNHRDNVPESFSDLDNPEAHLIAAASHPIGCECIICSTARGNMAEALGHPKNCTCVDCEADLYKEIPCTKKK